MTRIETERLYLRPWTLDDVGLWHQLAGDVGYTAFAPSGVFSVDGDEGARGFLRERVAQGAQGLGKWPVFARDGDVFVGTCGLSEYVIRDVPSVELGYRLLLAHWGRGYATEAARAMLDHGLRTLGLARVHAFVAPQNKASLAVIESLPFVRDGELLHAGLPHLLYVSAIPGGPVRRAVTDDAPALAALATALGYAATARELGPRLRSVTGDASARVWVAVEEGRVVGFVHARWQRAHLADAEVEVVAMGVDADHHGRGHGRRLMAEAEAWARQCGAGRVRLRSNVVRSGAHAFYERLGYARTKTSHTFERRL